VTALEDTLRDLVRQVVQEELERHQSAPERLLSVRQMCEATGLSRTSLHLACRRGDIVPIRIGRRLLFPESAIVELARQASGH